MPRKPRTLRSRWSNRSDEFMGGTPERRIPYGEQTAQDNRPDFAKNMATPETPRISLVTTARKTPAWSRNLFTLDVGFHGLMLAAGLTVLAVVGLILDELLQSSSQAWHQFGFHFFAASAWDPVAGDFGALPFIFGTVVSSVLALIIAVPLALSVAVFVTDMCPKPLRKPISFATELLAAIPSVIYGLWAMFILVPLLRVHVAPPLMKYLGWTGLFSGPMYGYSMLAAGVGVAIMIIPIISAIRARVSVL